MENTYDKKFLLRKIKLLIVGGAEKDLLETVEYLGFLNISIAESADTALQESKTTFFGFIICTTSINAPEFIKSLRNDSGSTSRFSPILGFINENDLSKEKIAALRDAGATEIVMSPFKIIPLREKIVSMIEKPRNFIISRNYTGPDRRRKKLEITNERRKNKEKE